MTKEQRSDLQVEWQVTSTRVKEQIKNEYRRKFGEKKCQKHWEGFLVEILNLRTIWAKHGLN